MNFNNLNSTAFNHLNNEPLNSNNFVEFVNFDGINFNDCGSQLFIEINDKDLGTIDLQTYNSPFQDGGGVLSSYMTQKEINIKMLLNKNDEKEVYDFLYLLKTKTNKQEGKLIIRQGGQLRYTFATLIDLTANRDSKSRNIVKDLDLKFISKTPHLIAIDPYSQTENTTNLIHYLDLNNVGSEETYYKIFIVFNAVNTISEVVINKDGYGLEIPQNFNIGDVLEINGEDKTVKLNTLEIDYNGIFVDLGLGSNPINIQFIGNSVNATITSTFLIRYR